MRAAYRLFDNERAELWGGEVGERSLKLADGSSYCRNDDYLVHNGLDRNVHSQQISECRTGLVESQTSHYKMAWTRISIRQDPD